MHRKVIPTIIIFFALIGTFSAFPQSFAGDTSLGASDCVGPSAETNHPADTDGTERFWIFDQHIVTYDPDFGAWQKNLLPVGSVGSFDVDDDTTGGFQTIFTLEESIIVGPSSPSFTDWHEEIVNSGWIWEGGIATIDGGTEVEGMVVDNTIWFFFDPPVEPDSVIVIEKEFAFVGPDGVFDSNPIDVGTISAANPLVLLQFPTSNNDCQPGEQPEVGGEIISIDSTALLVSTVQINSIWLLPLLISGIIIGIFIFQRK